MQAIIYILTTLQLLNIIIASLAISVGIKFRSKLKENKVLLLIPIFSLIQIFASEIIRFNYLNRYIIVNHTITIANVYVCFEYILLIRFFWNIKGTLIEKIIILTGTSAIIITSIITQDFSKINELFNVDMILFLEGPIFLLLSMFFLIRSMRNLSLYEYTNEPNVIATLGIFLSFLILWPTNILQKYFLEKPDLFYNFSFISNSVGYLILFSSLTYSAYVTRKPGNS